MTWSLYFPFIFISGGVGAQTPAPKPEVVLELAPSASNPRNSEGDFIQLKDGRVLLIYTHFTGGGGDNASAHLAARSSSDGGRTWTQEDQVILKNEGAENIMSVSLLRLRSGRIALVYLRKNSWDDCRPLIRFSDDEAATWTEPVVIVPDSEVGYYVVNNDRLVELADGRLVIPAAQHNNPAQGKFSPQGTLVCYLSDDGGQNWHRSAGELDGNPPAGQSGPRITLQEPGVVELTDHSALLFVRTTSGSQYFATSKDRCETWSPLQASELSSPVSPASIERIPGTENLMAVWNDHRNIAPELKGKRTPLSVAISSDEGSHWKPSHHLFDLPTGWYCYTAIEWISNDTVLLAHCAGDRSKEEGLSRLRVTRVPIPWVLAPATP
ncbi:MAG: exo-alpha-sialidase [Verrucomicrobiae bacterium]|nr:exo-alpha-sialidase [Verrucomicrobiae bacterium]